MASATKERTFKFYLIFIKFILLLEFYLFVIYGCTESSLYWLSLVAASRGRSPVAVRGFLLAVASPFPEHGLSGLRASVAAAYGLSICGSQAPECGLSSCGTGAQLLWGTWDLPGSGIEPISCLAGGFFTTEPSVKPISLNSRWLLCWTVQAWTWF